MQRPWRWIKVHKTMESKRYEIVIVVLECISDDFLPHKSVKQ